MSLCSASDSAHRGVASPGATAPGLGRLLVWTVLAAAFTAGQIQQSLHEGRHALPVVHDDVGYFVDAQWRLLDLYAYGVLRAIHDYVQAPPHSPTSTLLAAVGFALFGFRDWAPSAMNVVVVLGVLLFVGDRARGVRSAALVALGLFVLTWPLMGQLVLVCRPDILCALATASAVMVIAAGPWIAAAPREHYLAGFMAGLALLAKPSISPLTISVVLVALAIGPWADARAGGGRASWSAVRRAVLRAAGAAALVAGPHYIVASRHIARFLGDIAAGRNALLDWQAASSLQGRFAYFLTGPGGTAMMGPWLYVWGAIALAAALTASIRRDAAAGWRAASVGTVMLLVSGLVSFPERKSPFLGVVVPALFLASAVQMVIYLARVEPPLHRLARSGGLGIVLGVAVAGVLMFRGSYELGDTGRPPTPAHIRFLHERIARLTQLIGDDTRMPLNVFLTAYSDYLNADTLAFYLLKQPGRVPAVPAPDDPRRMVNVFLGEHAAAVHPTIAASHRARHAGRGLTVMDLHFSDDLAWYATMIRAATYVVSPSADYEGLHAWLPSTHIQGQVRALVTADPSLKLVAGLPNELGRGRLEVFRRNAPFEGVSDEVGLSPEEGPYPHVDPSPVRWGLAPRTSFTVILPPSGSARLIVEARSPLPEQEVVASIDSQLLSRHRYGPRAEFERVELSLTGAPGPHRVTLAYGRWLPPTAGESRPLAVLFRRIELARATGDHPSPARP